MPLRRQHKHRSAFSIIELIVTIGIVMILIGLLLPAISQAREQAKRTHNLSSIRGAMMMLTQYTSDHQEYYPLGWTDVVNAAMYWHLPLQISGHIDSWQDLGIINRDQNRTLIAMTQTAILNQNTFVPGAGLHLHEQPLRSQQTSTIRYSSHKGILFQYYVEASGKIPATEWCCGRDAPVAPIAFADGSALLATYKQFDVQPLPALHLRVGTPVATTWHGLAGRDVLVP
ncbi:MAG: type II secretion system protein [Phycisphaeraceae bacterium]|nr:type II secretion system protein [Phycisphaeraceae bacterium]MCW5762137.1 type II secretion system protein [Phycisphaeraceae bacterium]